MLRADFDNHQLWKMTAEIREICDQISAEHVPEELPLLERVEFYVQHVESFRDLATTSSALFSAQMLDQVQATFQNVLSSVAFRRDNGSGLTTRLATAADQAESVLMSMGPWPRPYGKGGQVTQAATLYEDLLEQQRKSITALQAEHAALLQEISDMEAHLDSKQNQVSQNLDELLAQGLATSASIDAQKDRIDKVISDGMAQIADLPKRNAVEFETWREGSAKKLERQLQESDEAIRTASEDADEILGKLRNDQAQYVELLSAVSGGTLAHSFEKDANRGRLTAIFFYMGGIVLLLASAAPLVLLFLAGRSSSGNSSWPEITIRLSIAVLGASAATVAIRLGGRFLSSSDKSRRMGLELRAFDPFLSSVKERESVDSARLELVDRAFFVDYAQGASLSEKTDDTISVSLLSQLVAAISKLAK